MSAEVSEYIVKKLEENIALSIKLGVEHLHYIMIILRGDT